MNAKKQTDDAPVVRGAANQAEERMFHRAMELFNEFFRATKSFRTRMAQNEKLWRAQHWEGKKDAPQPVTPMLFSTVENVLSDVMDNYPEPVIVGEENGDDVIAKQLNAVVSYILRRRGYKSIFRDKVRAALKKGTSVLEVLWDETLYGGLGDVNIRQCDIRNFLWDPACEDIQDGRAVFKFASYPREWFEARYPQIFAEEASPINWEDAHYESFDLDNNKTDELIMIEYWYKTFKDGEAQVHVARIAGGALLEHSARNMKSMYAHGKYPFIVEPLYRFDGEPVGMGLIDIYKDMQKYIDQMDQIILKNIVMSSKVKLLVNRGAEIDEAALTDWNSEVIRGSRIDENAVRWFQPAPLPQNAMWHYRNKMDVLKDESGQNQFTRGDGGKGVTAASAIIALQEAGSKRSRMIIAQLQDGLTEMVHMILELVRENYTERRVFRVTGESAERFEFHSGAMGNLEFDVAIRVQKQNVFQTSLQNDFAMQLVRMGVLTFTEAAEMMYFDGKEKVLAALREKQAATENAGGMMSLPTL